MNLVSQLYRLNRYLNILAQQAPIPVARLELLRLIKNKNPVTLRELADTQKVSMPTMSKLVDELQSQSLVIRAQAKGDARQRQIVPTQKGISELARFEKKNKLFWDEKLQAFSLEEKKQMRVMLDRLSDELEPK